VEGTFKTAWAPSVLKNLQECGCPILNPSKRKQVPIKQKKSRAKLMTLRKKKERGEVEFYLNNKLF